VSIRDYANYRMLRAFHDMRGRLEALDPDWFGKKRAQTRTINRRSGNPKDRYFMSGKTDLGGSLVRGDPDLLEWSIEMGLLDAPTLLTKHQVKRDSPAFALLSSKGGSVKIDAALLLNAYDTGNTRVLEQAIAARAPLRFTVAGKSHDLFARALIDGKFDLFSKMARYWDVNRKIPFTDGGHTYLMHYMTPSVRRFDKIFRGQPRYELVERKLYGTSYTLTREQSEQRIAALEAAGFDPNLRDSNGRTAWQAYDVRLAEQRERNDGLYRSAQRYQAERRETARMQSERIARSYGNMTSAAASAQQSFANAARGDSYDYPDGRRSESSSSSSSSSSASSSERGSSSSRSGSSSRSTSSRSGSSPARSGSSSSWRPAPGTGQPFNPFGYLECVWYDPKKDFLRQVYIGNVVRYDYTATIGTQYLPQIDDFMDRVGKYEVANREAVYSGMSDVRCEMHDQWPLMLETELASQGRNGGTQVMNRLLRELAERERRSDLDDWLETRRIERDDNQRITDVYVVGGSYTGQDGL
jgi:uncharacterized membrane protein YgcG